MNESTTTLKYTVIPGVSGPVTATDADTQELVHRYAPLIEVYFDDRFQKQFKADVYLPLAKAKEFADAMAQEEIKRIEASWARFEKEFNSKPLGQNRFPGVVSE